MSARNYIRNKWDAVRALFHRLVLPRGSITGDDLEQIFHRCGIDYPGRDIPPLDIIGTLMERSIELGKTIEKDRQNAQVCDPTKEGS